MHYGAAYYRFTVDIGAASLGEQEGRASRAGAQSAHRGFGSDGASDAVSFYINGIYMGTALPRGRSVWLVGRLPWRTGENESSCGRRSWATATFTMRPSPSPTSGSMRGLAPPVLISERTPGAGEYEEHVRTASMPSRGRILHLRRPQPGGRVVDAAWQLWRASIVEEEAEGALGAVRPFPLKLSGGEFAELQVVPPSLDGHLPRMGETAWARDQRGVVALGPPRRPVLAPRPSVNLSLYRRPLAGSDLAAPLLAGDAPLTIRLMGADRRGGILNGIEWLESIGEGARRLERRLVNRDTIGRMIFAKETTRCRLQIRIPADDRTFSPGRA